MKRHLPALLLISCVIIVSLVLYFNSTTSSSSSATSLAKEGDPAGHQVASTDRADPRSSLPVAFSSSIDDGHISSRPAFAVHGTVTDQSGEPIPDVAVGLHLLYGGNEPRVIEEAITDVSGKYLIELDRSPPSYLYWAEKAGYAPGWIPFRPPSGRIVRHDIVLSPAAIVAGIVIDDEGNHLPGVAVLPESSTLSAKESDAAGRFLLDSLAPGTAHVRFSKQGYVSLKEPLHAPAENLEFIMTNKGASVSGRVTFLGSGLPASGATLTIASSDTTTEVLADEDGYYHFHPLPAGSFWVTASSGTMKSEEQRLELASTDVVERYDLELFSGFTITGRVLHADKRTPIEGALISLADGYGSRKQPTSTSDANGDYRLHGIFARTGELEAQKKGFRPRDEQTDFFNFFKSSSMEYTIPEGGFEGRKEILLEESVKISGRVIHANGTPVVLGFLEWKEETFLVGEPPPSQPLGKGGAFEIEVNPNTSIRLTATSFNLYRMDTDVIPVGEEAIEGIEIVFQPVGTFSGQVVGPNREPMEGATLTYSYSFFDDSVAGYSNPVMSGATDGSFQFQAVPPAIIKLVANKEGFAEATLEVTLQPGEAKNDLLIQMQAGHAIAGRVLDREGKPISAILVHLVPEAAPDVKTMYTSEDGTFRFENLPAGLYAISARRSYVDPEICTLPGVAAGTEDLKLVLAAPSSFTLQGYVVDRTTRKPISDGTVNYAALTIQFKNGRFTLENLETSAFVALSISADGYLPLAVHESYSPMEHFVEATFELSRGGGVSGRVLDRSTGQPVVGASIVVLHGLWDSPGPASPRDESDAEGYFLIEQIPAGRRILELSAPAPYTTARVHFTVVDDEVSEVGDVLLGGGATILVRIVEMPGDTPLDNREVFLRGMGRTTTNRTLKTDKEGRVRFENIAAGDYFLSSGGVDTFLQGLRDVDERHVTLEIGSASLRGRLLRGGEPIAGSIQLRSTRNGTSVRREASASLDGRFEMKDVFPGEWHVELSTSLDTQPGIALPFEESIQLGSEEERDFHYPAGEIAITVKGGEGEPAADVLVRVQRTGDTQTHYGRRARTGANGRYLIRGVSAGMYELLAEKEEKLAASDTVQVSSNTERLEIELTLRDNETGILESIALRLSDGEPIPEAWCHVYTQSGINITSPLPTRNDRGILHHPLPVGKYRIEVSALGHSKAMRDVEIVAGETILLEDVLYESGSFRWILHDTNGAPVVGAKCTITPSDSNSIESVREGETDRRGYFEQDALFLGQYTARAQLSDGRIVEQPFDIIAHEQTERTAGLLVSWPVETLW